jgi:hypothetical protein
MRKSHEANDKRWPTGGDIMKLIKTQLCSTKGIGSPSGRAGGDFGRNLYSNLIPSIGGV